MAGNLPAQTKPETGTLGGLERRVGVSHRTCYVVRKLCERVEVCSQCLMLLRGTLTAEGRGSGGAGGHMPR